MNIITEFRIFKLVLVSNFNLNWQFWFFRPDLRKKGFSGLKQKRWTPLIFYIILHIQISQVQNFSSNWQFRFFGPNLPKKVFPVKNWKSEHHHSIPHIQISLGTKFQLKLTIDFFCLDLPKKCFSGVKQKKWTPLIFYIILLPVQISQVRNFNSDSQFWFFGPNLPKKVFRKQKKWISLWNWISLGTKF